MEYRKRNVLHRMRHDTLDLNEMALSSYRYPVPKRDTYVQYEEFVEQNIYINLSIKHQSIIIHLTLH